MKTDIKKEPKSIIKIKATLTKAEFQPYWDAAQEKASANIVIKGFRPGAAPKELVEGAVNPNAVFETAVNEAVRVSLKNISEENEWTIIDSPKVELLPEKEGLCFEAELSIFPEIKLADYKKIAKEKNEAAKEKEVKVEEKDIEESLKWLMKARGVEEANDEFAQSVGDFKTLDELKSKIKEGILAEKQMHEDDRRRLEIIDAIAVDSKIDLPEVMIQKQTEHLTEETKHMIQSSTGSLDEYMAKHYPDEKKFHEEMREQATKNLMKNLVIQEIAKAEKIEPSREDIELDANEILSNYGKEQAKSIDIRLLYDYSYGRILTKKVFSLLDNLA